MMLDGFSYEKADPKSISFTSYDTWSLGVILLEILTGIPVWMSLKCRAQTVTGKSLVSLGILGV